MYRKECERNENPTWSSTRTTASSLKRALWLQLTSMRRRKLLGFFNLNAPPCRLAKRYNFLSDQTSELLKLLEFIWIYFRFQSQSTATRWKQASARSFTFQPPVGNLPRTRPIMKTSKRPTQRYLHQFAESAMQTVAPTYLMHIVKTHLAQLK